METDLLVNPNMVTGGMANIETIDLPTLNFEEFSGGGGSSAPAAPAPPNLVPSFGNAQLQRRVVLCRAAD
jgi:hypothetical protein